MFPKQKLLREISSLKTPANYSRHIGDDLNPTEKKLFEAIAKGRIDVFKNILKNKHNEINWKKKDSQGYTFLQVAVFHSRKEMIQQLIKEGCETEPGYSLACELGDHDLTLLIIKCLNQTSASNHDEKEDTDEEIYDDGIVDAFPSTMQTSLTNDVDEIEDETKKQGCIEKISGQLLMATRPTQTSVQISDKAPNICKSVKGNTCNDRSSSERDPKPLILAAAAENFESVQKLIEGGYTCNIPEPHEPHQPYCNCDECADPLKQAHNRLQVYKALASTTYLILKESDPILAAIKRCEDLHALAKIYPENKTEFEEMAENTSKLAVDLMANCRNANEVEELLIQDVNNGGSNMHFKYGRLLLAVGLKHKKFVTHPNCQCVLSKLWYGNLFSVWKNWSIWRKFLHIIMHMLLTFFICTAYIIAPKRYFPNIAAIPFNRFIYSATSYLVFLGFLLFCAMYDEYNENHEVSLRWYDWYIAFWVLALLYKTIQDICIDFFVSYWTSWWTMYELVMVLIFFGACVCFLAGRSNPSLINSVKLIFVGSGLYSVAVTLAFMRVLQWFHLSHNFGHMIVSFSRMTEILFKLLIVFLVVLFAFSVGIHSLYKNFHPMMGENNNNTEQKTSFMNYGTTIKTLFWALFGDGEADYAAVPSSYFWHLIKPSQNRSSEMIITPDENSFSVIIGYILWSLFHVAFVIILLNMLIAVMTNSFEKIQENCDIEWKFARTKMWMYFFEDYNAVPPPFNLYYFLKYAVSFIKKIFRNIKSWRGKCPERCNRDIELVDSNSSALLNPKTDNSTGSKETKYTEILKKLIERYIHDKNNMKRLNLAAK